MTMPKRLILLASFYWAEPKQTRKINSHNFPNKIIPNHDIKYCKYCDSFMSTVPKLEFKID